MGVHLVFKGTESSETDDTNLELFCNINGEIYISIETDGYPPNYMAIDKPTAIKLSKHLKSQISQIV